MTTATNWSNITDFPSVLASANNNSPFWTGILMMIFAVFLVTFLRYGFIVALIGSGFLAFFIGIFLSYMGLVSWNWTLFMLGICILGILYTMIWDKSD